MLSKKIFVAFMFVLYIPIFVEIFYKFQILDHYSVYLEGSNSEKELIITSPTKKILFIGDSHTGLGYYINILRDSMPDQNIINAGVGGMGTKQLKLMAGNYLKIYRPETLVIQLYPGDDLEDIRYQISREKMSLPRNIYNFAYNNLFESVWFINSYMKNINGHFNVVKILRDKLSPSKNRYPDNLNNGEVGDKEANIRGSAKLGAIEYKMNKINPNTFNHWVKRMNLRASIDPNSIENQILLKGNVYPDVYNEFLEDLHEIINNAVKYNSNIIILVIPDKSQINLDYQNEFKLLGFSFLRSEELLTEVNYPFIRGIQDLVKNYPDKNIRIINPVEDFRRSEHINNMPLYLMNNTHLNYEGNKIISDLLIKELL